MSKQAFVFIHGVGGAGAAWAAQEAYFGTRYNTIGWNVPGYGGKPMLKQMNYETVAAALMKDLDECGAETAIVLGHSFGGMIAQAVVQEYSARVDKLILCGTSSAFGRPDGDFQKKFIADRLAPLEAGKTLADLAPSVMRGFQGDNPDPDGVALAIACMGAVPEETYRTALQMIAGFDMRAGLSKIACPTLLISGEKDTAAPAAMMERMAARIDGAHYQMMPGCGHLMGLEQPAQFNAIIDKFLEETKNV